MIKQLFLFITLLLPSTENAIVVQRPLIYFEKLFTNPKDAYQVRGETVDGNGYIHSFNNRNDKPGLKYREWNLGKKDYEPFSWQMTIEEAQKNLGVTDSVIGHVNQDTLSKYIKLLSLINESNKDFGNTLVVSSTSDVRNTRSDNISLYGFIYDSKRKIYKRILIERHGGVEWQNQSELVSEFKQWKW